MHLMNANLPVRRSPRMETLNAKCGSSVSWCGSMLAEEYTRHGLNDRCSPMLKCRHAFGNRITLVTVVPCTAKLTNELEPLDLNKIPFLSQASRRNFAC